jgi:hypothetical protein
MITIDKYTTLNLEEYEGVYSLLQGFTGNDGSFKMSWIKEEIGPKDNKQEKSMPKRVKLGDQKTALAVADAIYDYFQVPRHGDDPGDVPF